MGSSHSHENTPALPELFCPVCYMKDNLRAIDCGHFFCLACLLTLKDRYDNGLRIGNKMMLFSICFYFQNTTLQKIIIFRFCVSSFVGNICQKLLETLAIVVVEAVKVYLLFHL